MSTATHLVIASRHPLHREALALALRSSHDCAATITTLVPNHVLEYLQEHNADIVVMAGDPSDCDWLSILSSLSKTVPGTPVIVLSSSEPEEFATSCLEAGASGYLTCVVSFEEFKRALTSVMCGEVVCSEKATRFMFGRLARLSNKNSRLRQLKSVPLTVRELEILALVSIGYTNEQVGDQLCISVHTVKNHVHKILMKLEVDTRLQAVHLAYEQNWIQVNTSKRSRSPAHSS